MQANKYEFPADGLIFYEQKQLTERWGYVQKFQIPWEEHFHLTASVLLTVSAFDISDFVLRNTFLSLLYERQSVYEISIIEACTMNS